MTNRDRECIAAHVAGFGASGPTPPLLRYPAYTAEQLRPHFDALAETAMKAARSMLDLAEQVEPVDFLLARQYQETFESLSHAGLQRAIRNYQDAEAARDHAEQLVGDDDLTPLQLEKAAESLLWIDEQVKEQVAALDYQATLDSVRPGL